MHGRYGPDQGNPKRYMVEFYRVAFRPIPFHSDIVYLDDDLRINYGKLGGFYVLERLNEPGHSVLRDNPLP